MRVLRAVARPTGARGLSTSAPTWPLLTREFIRLALYDRERGYFVQRRVIGRPSAPIDFGSLLGKLEYDQLVQRTYRSDENAEAWTTPVELFAPWLSHAIAECVLREFKERQKRPAAKRSKGPGATRRPQITPTLNLIEIGAGTGSNGIHILDYLRVRAPEVYAATRFTTIEISPTLADAQRARFAAQHARVHRAICADATRLLEAPEVLAMRTDDPVFVVALEVLDNLPHDKGATHERTHERRERGQGGEAGIRVFTRVRLVLQWWRPRKGGWRRWFARSSGRSTRETQCPSRTQTWVGTDWRGGAKSGGRSRTRS